MKEVSASVRVYKEDLRGLQALSRLDHDSVGHQIRLAIAEYLQRRRAEVEPEKARMMAEWKAVLEQLVRAE